MIRLTTILFLGSFVLACTPRDDAPAEQPPVGGEPEDERGRAASAPETLPAGNLLESPSFETIGPWYAIEKPLWKSFTLDDEVRFSGRRSARLTLDNEGYAHKIQVVGAVQEVQAATLPAHFSGRFRVEEWERGLPNQYVQVVVIIWEPRRTKNSPPEAVNLQLAYVLGGIDQPPFQITNRRFIFLGSREPKVGAWDFFDVRVAQDFERAYGFTPVEFSGIRILLEVRFEGNKGRMPTHANVYYDDVYLGPHARSD